MGTPPTQIGPYRILGELGRGGMGVVYRARREDLQREFALKVLTPAAVAGETQQSALLARFAREAQAAAELAGHPGIVGVHDIGEDDGRLYLAMDLVNGPTLEGELRGGALEPRIAARRFAKTARALAYAHSRGLLHRDIKPGNLLVGPGTTLLLADFGLAKRETADPQVTRLTQSGEVLGTPSYMPPEQARGDRCDERSDVYSLGATLYEALTGAMPFAGDSVYAVLAQVVRTPPKRLRFIDPRVPRDLETIVMRCLEKRPEDRYGSAGALAADLEAFVEGESIVARRPSVVRRAGRWVRDRALAVGAAALVAGGIGIAVGVWFGARGEQRGAQADIVEAAAASSRAELGQAQVAGWATLERSSGAAIVQLLDKTNGVGLDAAAVAAALATVDAAVGSIAGNPAAARLGEAWRAYGRALAGDVDAPAALERIVAATSPDDPLPHLVWARWQLGRYVRSLQLPYVVFSTEKVIVSSLQESNGHRRLREQAADALRAAAHAPTWPTVARHGGLAHYAAGASAVAEGRLEAAADHLARLQDDPILGPEAAVMEGICRYVGRQFEAAAVVFGRPAGRRWRFACQAAMTAWLTAAQVAVADGKDARPLLRRGLAVPAPVGADGQPYAAAHATRAQVAAALAKAEAAYGGDPRPIWAEAIAAFRAVLKATPKQSVIWNGLGIAHQARAAWLRDRGEDNAADLKQSADALAGAVNVRPDYGEAWANLAQTQQSLAQLLIRRGQDPTGVFEAGRHAADRAVMAGPRQPGFVRARAGLAFDHAQWLDGQGRDPTERLAAALVDLEACLKLDPAYSIAFHTRGQIHQLLATRAQRTREDPRPHFRNALQAFAQLLQRNPRQRAALLDRANTYRRLAVLDRKRPAQALALLDEAAKDDAAMVALNATDPVAQFSTAETLRERANVYGSNGQVPRAQPLWEEAVTVYARVTQLGPRFWQAHLQRSDILDVLGRPREALAALQAGLAINPASRRAMQGRLQKLQAKVRGG